MENQALSKFHTASGEKPFAFNCSTNRYLSNLLRDVAEGNKENFTIDFTFLPGFGLL